MLNRSATCLLNKLTSSRTALAIAASLIAFGLGGCDLGGGSTGDEISPKKQRALDSLRRVPKKLLNIDEFGGTYAGVGLGDAPKEVMRVFGPAPELPNEHLAADADPIGTGPSYSCDGLGGNSDFLRYLGVSFWVNRGAVCALRISAEGAETRRGIAVGDSIGDVEAAYPELACRDSSRPSEFTLYRYCLGRLAPYRYVWFSAFEGKPVDGIELGVYPFCESCVRKPSFYRAPSRSQP